MPQFPDQPVLPKTPRVDDHDQRFIGFIELPGHQHEDVGVIVLVYVYDLRFVPTERHPSPTRPLTGEAHAVGEAAPYRRTPWDAHAEISDRLPEVVDSAHGETVAEIVGPLAGKSRPYRGNAAHRPSHDPSQDKALNPVQTTHQEPPGHPRGFRVFGGDSPIPE